MPKMKTKRSEEALPRRPGGTVKRGQAFKRHILTKKSTRTSATCADRLPSMRPTWVTWRRCCRSQASND